MSIIGASCISQSPFIIIRLSCICRMHCAHASVDAQMIRLNQTPISNAYWCLSSAYTKLAYLIYIIGVGDLFLITNLIVFFHHSMFAYFLFYHRPQDSFQRRVNVYNIVCCISISSYVTISHAGLSISLFSSTFEFDLIFKNVFY